MNLDLILAGARVHDGSGFEAFHADVGVVGDRIVEVGDLSGVQAARRIDVTGLVVAPGFVDIHSHADFTISRPEHVHLLAPLLRQGITTFVGGNCGAGLAPVGSRANEAWRGFLDSFMGESPFPFLRWDDMGGFLDTVERQGTLLNFAMLAPHGILRMLAMEGRADLRGPDDLRRMTALLEACLDAGAVGMSAGLQYFPGLYSTTGELVELARVVRRYGGVFTAHLRSYNSDTLPQAIDEVLQVGREAAVPVQISHLFWCPNPRWPLNRLLGWATRAGSRLYRYLPVDLPIDGGPVPLLERIGRAIDAGQPVGLDAMPTSAAFTHLLAFLPPSLLVGSLEQALARLRDPATRRQVRRSIEEGRPTWPHRAPDTWSLNLFKVLGWDMAWVMSLRTEKNQRFVGRNLVDIGDELGKHPFDVLCDLLVEEEGRVLAFETTTHPGDPFLEGAQRSTLCHPHCSIVTDTILMGFGMPSHLFHDAIPRFLAGTARHRKDLPLREAIRKCTSLPASQLRLRDRGLVRRGWKADLVAFDPAAIGSNSTAMAPAAAPDGIRYVVVNGGVVLDPEGLHTDRLHGQVIRR